VINAAFPVIRSDGTALWEDGMDADVKVATPAEMCAAKASGQTIVHGAGDRLRHGWQHHVRSIWGAYLPIVKKYADNGRLWWVNYPALKRRACTTGITGGDAAFASSPAPGFPGWGGGR
jgi:hypothetical protein